MKNFIFNLFFSYLFKLMYNCIYMNYLFIKFINNMYYLYIVGQLKSIIRIIDASFNSWQSTKHTPFSTLLVTYKSSWCITYLPIHLMYTCTYVYIIISVWRIYSPTMAKLSKELHIIIVASIFKSHTTINSVTGSWSYHTYTYLLTSALIRHIIPVAYWSWR